MASTPNSAVKSEEEWRAVLSPEQFHILREKGTESVLRSTLPSPFLFFCDYFGGFSVGKDVDLCCVGCFDLHRPRGTGHYDKFYEEGIYNCAGCGTPLYKSTTKFNSGCGWPAFFQGLPGAINRSVSIPT